MAITFVTVNSGATASAAVAVTQSERTLLVGVASLAANGWFPAFQAAVGGAYLRVAPTPGTAAVAVFSGASGGWGTLVYPPGGSMRLETATALTTTTSVAVLTVPR